MRILSTFFVLVLSVLFVSSSVYAGTKSMSNGVLQIRKAAEPPVIDGEMDDVWLTTTAEQMFMVEGQPIGTIFGYDDHYSAYRVLWDEDYFYVFMSVVDDSLYGGANANTGSPWLNDCVEIFFDGENEKATSYDANDVQWRWVWGETVETHPATGTSPGEWMWKDTPSGYNFELRIPAASITQFPLEADHEIGFEISNGDLETVSSPQLVLHWWTNVATTWNDPSLFGTAVLTEDEVNGILEIAKTDDAPVIDGEMTDGEGWENSDEFSLTRFEGAPDVYPQDSVYTDRTDAVKSFKILWDDEYLYLFVHAIDDSLFGGALANTGSPWLNDCVEMFIDGENEKATSYDANDVQWRWVLDETVETHPATGTAPGEWMWKHIDGGWDFELRIPAASLTQFPLELEHELGFELSSADLETASSPQRVLHWWTNVATTWNNPSLFGTAILSSGTVDVESTPGIVTEYNLQQNYPNPFNPSTIITYSVPSTEKVRLTVYNVLGNEVAELVNETKSAGTYTARFNAGNLASGVYFYRLEAGGKLFVNKMMFLK